MKRCPECRRDYFDDSLLYCLDDGCALLEGPASGNEPATRILHDTSAPVDAVTRAQVHTTDIPALEREPAVPPTRSRTKGMIIAAVMIVVIGAVGYFGFLARSASGQIDSIAVMPFVNASGDPNIEYLSDGVTESLISNLSQLPKLSVKARSSVFRYKGKDVEPEQVARDLKVQAVLAGRITQHGENMTFSLELVDGSTGNQIWGEQYTRKAGDLAALQSEIARDVSQKLRTRLSGADEKRVVKNQTGNSEAYQLYLQGRYNWNKRTDATTRKAIEYFQRAIEKDPTYAMAYVGLAEAYVLGDEPDSERYPKVKAAADKAIELDPTLGEPHAALAVYFDSFQFDHAAGEREFKTAIELSPNYSTSYHWWAETLISWGRFDEGLAVYKKALEIDPFSMAIGTDYGIGLYYARQYDRAIEQLKKLTEVDPTYIRTYTYLERVYQITGQFEEALNAREKRLTLEGADPREITEGKKAILGAFKTSGPKGYWPKMLEFALADSKTTGRGAVALSRIYAQLGDRDEAMKWLSKAANDSINDDIFMIGVAPEWDSLRDDPRFIELMKKLRLP